MGNGDRPPGIVVLGRCASLHGAELEVTKDVARRIRKVDTALEGSNS